VENEEPKVIKLSAIGKYPYISSILKKLNFETLLVGSSKTKEIVIKNAS